MIHCSNGILIIQHLLDIVNVQKQNIFTLFIFKNSKYINTYNGLASTSGLDHRYSKNNKKMAKSLLLISFL